MFLFALKWREISTIPMQAKNSYDLSLVIICINNWSVDFWINYMNKNKENIWIKENTNIMHIFSEGFSETLFKFNVCTYTFNWYFDVVLGLFVVSISLQCNKEIIKHLWSTLNAEIKEFYKALSLPATPNLSPDRQLTWHVFKATLLMGYFQNMLLSIQRKTELFYLYLYFIIYLIFNESMSKRRES